MGHDQNGHYEFFGMSCNQGNKNSEIQIKIQKFRNSLIWSETNQTTIFITIQHENSFATTAWCWKFYI